MDIENLLADSGACLRCPGRQRNFTLKGAGRRNALRPRSVGSRTGRIAPGLGRASPLGGRSHDSSRTDASRTALVLARPTYPARDGYSLRTRPGFVLCGYRGWGAAGGPGYRLYGGTIFLDISPQPGSAVAAV